MHTLDRVICIPLVDAFEFPRRTGLDSRGDSVVTGTAVIAGQYRLYPKLKTDKKLRGPYGQTDRLIIVT